MKCFTDEQLLRGMLAVREAQAFGRPIVRSMTDADWIGIFLAAAQGAAPVVHPMACAGCGRFLTTEQGIVLLPITVREGRWRCAVCAPEPTP
jgi:hypothetical protein